MIKDIQYNQLSLVLETWDAARFGCENFDDSFGMVTLVKLMELQPRAKKVFGYDRGEDEGDKIAQVHAKAFVDLLDSVFQMLGPDLEFISDILEQLGRRHKAMGVSPAFFPFMGQAIIHTLGQFLKKPLTEEQRDAWEEVFDSISNEITKSILGWDPPATLYQTTIDNASSTLFPFI